MRFQSAITNRVEVVLAPDITKDQFGRKIGSIPGLMAKFTGRELDTSKQGWTPAQERQVIEHILSHPEFGRFRTMDGGSGPQRGTYFGNIEAFELYFASGQELEAEWLEFCEQLPWYQKEIAAGVRLARGAEPVEEPAVVETPATGGHCAFATERDDGTFRRCGSFTKAGELYCAKHIEKLAAVS